VSWFKKAAVAGDAWGMAIWGVCLERGVGVGENKAEALLWYWKAAAAGMGYGAAQLAMLRRG
jgi:TPR repeat protein